MEGKYIINASAYDKQYGMVSVRKCFKGDKATAYTQAMEYAYKQANRFKDKGVDFTVTIQGEGWRTADNVNPM